MVAYECGIVVYTDTRTHNIVTQVFGSDKDHGQ